jgi:hypothetical protein
MKSILTAVACSAVLAVGAMAWAETPASEPVPATPKSVCISPSDIDHLSYPDDKTILFHMKSGKVRIWRNDLKATCPGLKFESAVAWEIRGGSICSNMQPFYVLRRWNPCMLGAFTPYTPPKEDADKTAPKP